MGGYAGRAGPSEGVHDDLECHALAVEGNDGNVAVVVSADLVAVCREDVETLKSRVKARLGLPPENLLFAATHTHSGPRTAALFGEPWEGTGELMGVAFEAVELALEDLRPADVEAIGGTIGGVGYNRREWDPSSEVVDETAVALVVRDGGSGKVRGVAFNYGLHPVVLPAENLLVSADWPHFTREILARSLLPSGVAFVTFLQGATGNVNPFNVPFNGNKVPNTFADAERVGAMVADGLRGVLQASDQNEPGVKRLEVAGGVRCATKTVTLRADDPEKLEDFTWATLVEVGGQPAVQTVVQVLNLGGFFVAAVPGELFAELGLRLRASLPSDPSFVVTTANDYVGYVTTRAAYEAGGYEALAMGLSATEGEELLAALDELASNLTFSPR
ncbi:MAG: hypothetical protein Kow0069_27520 [Promethearchaeota archaeon]